MKLHRPTLDRIARHAGGLFFGVLFHFPANIDLGAEHVRRVSLKIGLIFWRLSFDLSYRRNIAAFEKCEGCLAAATVFDPEGVPLCAACLEACEEPVSK